MVFFQCLIKESANLREKLASLVPTNSPSVQELTLKLNSAVDNLRNRIENVKEGKLN